MSIFGIAAALLCLALLIFWHELGHFLAARWCGVYVERFSVGFGKALLRWQDKRGTEYCLAALPFGGYVRMYGEDTPGQGARPQVPADAKSFNAATVPQKLLIVLAGPAFNILLTWLILSLLNLGGTTSALPYVNNPPDSSPAAQLQRDDRIISIDGKAVTNWRDVEIALVDRIGETGTIALQATRGTENLNLVIPIKNWLQQVHQPQPSRSLGLIPWSPVITPTIAQVVDGSAAAQAGIQPGDLIKSVDGAAVTEWQQLVTQIQQSARRPMLLGIDRSGNGVVVTLIPDARPSADNPDIETGHAGIAVQLPTWPEDRLVRTSPGVVGALTRGMNDSLAIIRLIGVSLAKLLTGDIAFSNLSGPVGIIQYAGDSAESGLVPLLAFAAYMSMSLGLLNLLPIPVLDGGQALLIIFEGVKGSPLGISWRDWLMRGSMALLLALMLVTTFNDLLRLW